MPLRTQDTQSLNAPLLVHCHLRWDFVWQRPQQLLSRLAKSQPVLFIEEPIFLDDLTRGRLDVTQPQSNIYRAVPHLPGRFRESYDDAVAEVRDLVRETIGTSGLLAGRFDRPVQWFYTPMPAPAMLGAFDERAVVYDCMDELAQFRFAPTDLGQRERLLLAHADVVFTGGYKLYRSKSRHHQNVHFFGCGVDVDHFGKARAAETAIPEDIRHLPGPVLGYFGVIDERLDYGLIKALADAFPDASVAMIGPVVKVDPAQLPQGANIHWLGQRDYAQLPAYVKGFDLCLMPFALNEATEFINPTKTLEYMAAGKPILSTPVADVVTNFVPIVRVAATQADFVAEARRAVDEPRPDVIERGIARAATQSWDGIVQQMRKLIAEAVAPAESTRRTATVARARVNLSALAGEAGAAPAA